jgi:hypothetical protein
MGWKISHAKIHTWVISRSMGCRPQPLVSAACHYSLMSWQKIIPVLAGTEVASWTRPDITTALTRAGYRVVEEADGGLTVSGGALDIAVARRLPYQREDEFGEYTRLSATAEYPAGDAAHRDAAHRDAAHRDAAHRDAAYRGLLREFVAVLGPPPLVGGPGAFALWRRPDTTLRLARRLRQEHEVIVASVEPTDAVEKETARFAKFGEDWQPEYRWLIEPDPGAEQARALAGMTTYRHSEVEDFSSLATTLWELFGSLTADLPVLHPYASGVVWTIDAGEEAWLAQGWFAHDVCHLELGGTTGQVDLPPGLDSARRIVALVMRCVRSSGVTSPRQLRHTAFASQKPQRLVASGLGLPYYE